MEETTPQENAKSSTSKFLIPIAIVIIIIGIVVFATNSRKKEDAVVANKTEETNSPTGEAMQEPPSNENSQSPDTSSTGYKDGIYSATGNYVSPGGAEELGVQITLKDGIITDANVDSKATRPNSVIFQGKFVSGYKPLVVGKNVDDVQLTTVSGSSLSPKGFNEALSEIKAQAKS